MWIFYAPPKVNFWESIRRNFAIGFRMFTTNNPRRWLLYSLEGERIENGNSTTTTIHDWPLPPGKFSVPPTSMLLHRNWRIETGDNRRTRIWWRGGETVQKLMQRWPRKKIIFIRRGWHWTRKRNGKEKSQRGWRLERLDCTQILILTGIHKPNQDSHTQVDSSIRGKTKTVLVTENSHEQTCK